MVSVYYRKGAGGKTWNKIPRFKYCYRCGMLET